MSDDKKSPNDQRSDAKNPNNPKYKKAIDHKANQYNPKADTRSPNDQRSDVKNPNNPEYKANMDNRADQLNPNNDK